MSAYVLTLPQSRLFCAFYKNKKSKRRIYVGEKYMHQKDVYEFNDKQTGKMFSSIPIKEGYYIQANLLPWNVSPKKKVSKP